MKMTLAAARVNAGYTQKEVSEILGVSCSTVVEWEKGRISPRYEQVKRMCEIYKRRIEELEL